jgi:chromosomal replication initiation ATPase DnaA
VAESVGGRRGNGRDVVDIGRDVFDRDHSTVLHAIRHIESMMMQRLMFQETIRSISERIRKRLGL